MALRTAQLIKPGQVFKYSGPKPAITPSSLEEASRRYQGFSNNFGAFYGTVNEGKLLDAILHLTDSESFLSMTLAGVQRNAGFRNMMADLLHAEHTSYHSISGGLGWYGFYASWFTATPIPKNIKQIEKGRKSLELLAAIGADENSFYDQVRKGVYAAEMSEDTLKAGEIQISVSAVVEVGHQKLQPQMVTPGSREILIGDQVYYNGLPGDRARYPTYALPEGSRLRVEIKNTSRDKVYLVAPTINGIPFHVERAVLDYESLTESALPVVTVEHAKKYLKPGETLVLDHFQVDKIYIARDAVSSSYASSISDTGSQGALEELTFIAEGLIRERFSPQDLASLEALPEPLKRQILFESGYGYLKEWLGGLQQAKKTEIYMRRPVLAGSMDSSDLDNPFLGSLGLSVIQVSRPPVVARHESSWESSSPLFMGGGVTRGGGIAGLGSVGGGFDLAAVRADPFNFQYDSAIHKFVGYYPINLMSTSEMLRVV